MQSKMEFEERDIEPYFTFDELEATGADLTKIKVGLMVSLMSYRAAVGEPVHLIKDGLTSGKHEPNSLHYQGCAVDFFVRSRKISIDHHVSLLLQAGFRGIGVYYNGKIITFHADLRSKFTFWSGVKTVAGAPWKYGGLIDPMGWDALKRDQK